ncbi:hypothetical protein BDB01DRAFT_813515 [Pilobolus umbonatus]|nr:hypothetical protein BDB01DRAFT_813515 [Pilobolus umbonatus]
MIERRVIKPHLFLLMNNDKSPQIEKKEITAQSALPNESIETLLQHFDSSIANLQDIIQKSSIINKDDITKAATDNIINHSKTLSVTLSETVQTIMNHIDTKLDTIQTVMENKTNTTVDNVIKAAAETASQTASQVFQSMLIHKYEQQKFVVVCDGCYTPIQSQMWHCETCEDYDLCGVCKSRLPHNPNHKFNYINKSYPDKHISTQANSVYQPPEDQKSIHSSASDIFKCDYCASDIVGIHHTCTACPDFDLCNACFSIVNENHPAHTFITRLVGTQEREDTEPLLSKSRVSHDLPTAIVKHCNVQCGHCNKEIQGVRYKCGHCIDYDLCSECEERSFIIHDEHHVFLKIRQAINVDKMILLPEFQSWAEKEIESKRQLTPKISTVNAETPSLNNRNKAESSASSTVEYTPFEPKADERPLYAQLVSDVTFPDNSIIERKSTFVKMWKVRNNGSTTWPEGCRLLFNGGTILKPYPPTYRNSTVLSSVLPGQETCVSAELQTPDYPGTYTSYFRFATPDGERFGDFLWCIINVPEQDEFDKVSPSHTEPMLPSNHYSEREYPPPLNNVSNITYHSCGMKDKEEDYDTDEEDNTCDMSARSCSGSTSEASPIIIEYSNGYMSSAPSDFNYTTEDNRTGESDSDDGNEILLSPLRTFTISSNMSHDDFILISEEEEDMIEEGNMRNDRDTKSDSEMRREGNAGEGNPIEEEPLSSSAILIPNTQEANPSLELFQYKAQLLQIHEMGLTEYNDIAMGLLSQHKGQIDKVIPQLLEALYR